MRKYLLLLASVFVVGIVSAQTKFNFVGRIDNYKVVVSLSGYISGVSGEMYYVSQGKDKKLQLRGESMSILDSDHLVWKFVETVNGRYNGTYYVVWDGFLDKSYDIIGAYINSKGCEYEVNLRCTGTEMLRDFRP